VAAGASLYVVYILFIVLFLQRLDRSTVDLVESLVIVTQVARLAGVVAYFGLKPARVEVLLVLLSLETFVVMGLIMLYLVYPSAVFSQMAHTVFSTWVVALFTILPPYLVFTGITEMTRRRSLTTVILSLSLEFGFLTFAASTLLGFGGAFTLANFFDFMTVAAKTDLAAGAVPQVSTFAIIIPTVAMYCSMLVYATLSTATGDVSPKVNFVLPLLGAVVALGWVFAAASFVPNTLLSFTVPGIIVVALLWAYMRR